MKKGEKAFHAKREEHRHIDRKVSVVLDGCWAEGLARVEGVQKRLRRTRNHAAEKVSREITEGLECQARESGLFCQ